MSQELFRVQQIRTANVVELNLPIQLDNEDFNRLNESLLALFGQQKRGTWIIDLTGSQYMGSSVLGLMVNIRQQVKEGGGKLALCGMSTQLLRIFQTCCLERLFTIKGSRDDALRAVGA